MRPLHSDSSSYDEKTPECAKENSSSPCESTSLKRKFTSDALIPSTTNDSITQMSSKEMNKSKTEDLITSVPTVSEDSDSDGLSPPTKKRHTAKNDEGTKRKPTRTRWKSWAKQRLVDAFQECTEDVWLEFKPPDLELCGEILAKFPENPGITRNNIQTFIYNVLLKEHRRRVVNGYPIDKWTEIVDAVSPKENNIAKQLELIMTVAKQEPNDDAHTLPTFDKSLPQPSYEAIYDYLSKAFSGKPLPGLTPIDSLVVEDLMQSLVFQVESLNDGELRKSLRQVYLHFAQEPDEEPEHEHEELRKSLMHSITILNPLGLNAQSIVPVPPK